MTNREISIKIVDTLNGVVSVPSACIDIIESVLKSCGQTTPNSRYAAALEVWEEWAMENPLSCDVADLKGWLQQRLNSAGPNHA